MERSSCLRSCRGVCGTCKPISEEFEQILNHNDSGLTIYVHNNKNEENQKSSASNKKQDKIVLHNTTDKDLKRSDHIKELSKYKTQCFRCNTVLQQIHGLLDEIKEIRENEVRVVCQYCKTPNSTGQCSRCQYLVNKFVTTKVKEYERRIQRFDEWLSKLKHILHAILEERNRAKGISKIQQDLASNDELEKLLLELKTQLKITSRQPQIRELLEILSKHSAASVTENKDILETLLNTLKTVTKPDFKPAEEVKSGNSSISLPPIKTVFKVLPKKSVGSAFPLLPPSSEMLSNQRSFIKGTVPFKKQTQLVERDRDIDHPRSHRRIIITSQIQKDAKRSKELAKGKDKIKMTEELWSKERSKKFVTKKQTYSTGLVKNELENVPIKMHTSGSESVEVGKTGEKGRYGKGSKGERQMGADGDGKSKIKIAKDGKNYKHAKGKEKSKQSDESDISDKENQKKSSPKDIQKIKYSISNTEDLKLLKEREKQKKIAEKAVKVKNQTKPEIKYSKKPVSVTVSDLGPVVTCESEMEALEMIKGTKVLKYNPYYKYRQPEGPVQPLLFSTQPELRTPPEVKKPSPPKIRRKQPTNGVSNIFDDLEQPAKGVLKYALSNRNFIDNGYTLMPTSTLMRQHDIYKMIPANPEYDWFERHKKRRLFYETGEILAEVDEDGHGRWYYKNGIIALNYYKAKEVNAGNRYVIYSSGQSDGFDQDQEQKQEPTTVLACFDHSGCGIVYDQHGNVRLKYNQTEGIVMDEKIGPIARWKWNDLNDPPIVKTVIVDNYLEIPAGCQEKLGRDVSTQKVAENSDIILKIELENFDKKRTEKTHAVLKKYKPFQIRMKACRINNEFSLKVIDQANIHLLFRSGQVSFKLNLGMVLINNEIVYSDIVDATQIWTPYDRVLPRSKSVADIKRIVEVTRKRSLLRLRRKDNFAPKSFLSPDNIADQLKREKDVLSAGISHLLSRNQSQRQHNLCNMGT